MPLGQAVVNDPLKTTEFGQIECENDRSEYDLKSTTSLQKSWQYQYLKRIIDIFGSLILIIVLVLPGLIIAAAILLSSRGPVFYREERLGHGGKPFKIWKFRSMHRHASRRSGIKARQSGGVVLEWRMCKDHADPRITTVGRFLRRWSLDEIPQLINVLLGDMSLVGPRPIVRSETSLYGDLFSYYMAATPGLSGAWQISGRSEIGYDDRARLDALYVSNWSIRTDIGILLRTIPAVLSRVGAY